MQRPFIKYIISITFILSFWQVKSKAQAVDTVFNNNIKTVQLYASGDQLSFPLIKLNSPDQLELHFDDMQADVKYYYYTLELCNYDWTPTDLSSFDYLRGFTQMRIGTYRNSSIAYTRYTHYQTTFPDRNLMPTRSGNYICKVFLDGDPSKVVLTKRFMVVDNKAIIKAQNLQPYNAQYFRTHQKIQFTVTVNGVDAFSAGQLIKVAVLQNGRWDKAVTNISPNFVRTNSLEYNNEDNLVFGGGKEWRWLDIRDFHLQSDRVLSAQYNKTSTEIFVKPDIDRSSQRYVYYNDRNGRYSIENTININPFWQADYATVHFSFSPPGNVPFDNKDLYISGMLTDYKLNEQSKMNFNKEKGIYEGSLLLKEGFYDYGYTIVDKITHKKDDLDGNYFETENDYTILIYYRSYTDRADQLIGVSRIDSRSDNPGFSF